MILADNFKKNVSKNYYNSEKSETMCHDTPSRRVMHRDRFTLYQELCFSVRVSTYQLHKVLRNESAEGCEWKLFHDT